MSGYQIPNIRHSIVECNSTRNHHLHCLTNTSDEAYDNIHNQIFLASSLPSIVSMMVIESEYNHRTNPSQWMTHMYTNNTYRTNSTDSFHTNNTHHRYVHMCLDYDQTHSNWDTHNTNNMCLTLCNTNLYHSIQTCMMPSNPMHEKGI